MGFSEAMARRRVEMGITQTVLAGKIGVTKAAISNIERGTAFPYLITAIKIAAELCMSIDEMVADTSTHTPTRGATGLSGGQLSDDTSKPRVFAGRKPRMKKAIVEAEAEPASA